MSRSPEVNRLGALAIQRLLVAIIRGESVSSSGEVIKNPNFDDVPLDALRAQNDLAELVLQSWQLTGMRLNTLKKHADTSIAGGYAQLEELRIAARDKLEADRVAAGKAGRGTKAEVQSKLDAANHQLSLYREDLQHVTAALRVAMQYMRTFAKEADTEIAMARLATRLEEVRLRASPAKSILSVVPE